MSRADNIEQIAADHRAASQQLRAQIAETNARAAAKSQELVIAAVRAAQERAEPPYEQVAQPVTRHSGESDEANESDEDYRPKSWLI